ncbi:MAG: Flp pilus assembly complex ATPase component TadA [Candidatus Heimdallarchaeota archaeon]|nr:Flp pilus assembly complex ATPase component TadA [Candidatus Heimdallarchaeota archaeon]MCK5143417.1 Flp pilus assembly complex ATPase component TadA [Candidatus Heimdallarchaeota archaeon]
MHYVPDTSTIINGQFLKYLAEKEDIESIVLSRVVIAEIENMANQAKTAGMTALEELQRMRDFCAKQGINMIIDGQRPTYNQIRGASIGELDAQIRELAAEYDAILITSDRVMAEIGKAEGLAVVFMKEETKSLGKKVEDYFDEQTMSLHLRENNLPLAKKGLPGNFQLIPLQGEPILTRETLDELAKDVIERASREKDSFIESDRHGTTVIQLKNTRIVILRPPFSDAMEITAVRPIVKLTLGDYKIDSKLLERIETQAEGIIIAGPPGAGKSTFATAMAEFYADKDKIVKTFENPRDLQVDNRITQMSGFEGDISASADLVLLMRPDYVIYDELRRTKDFETYSDLRLAGVGLLGVVHATQAIDGLQRFIKRVDLGIIPSIVDTIIFISEGKISKVYTLELTVTMPKGFTERDLSRPVIKVKDFHTNKDEYEIYTFGEQIVVSPLMKLSMKHSKTGKTITANSAQIQKVLKQYSVYDFTYDFDPPNSLTLFVSNKDKPRVIGKDGRNIDEIEQKLGLSITVKSFNEQEEMEFVIDMYPSKGKLNLVFPSVCVGKDVILAVNGSPLTQLTVGKTSEISVAKNTEIGKMLMEAHQKGDTITALL